MTFDQWLHNLRQALGVQEQQIRIVSGALLFLLCIVLWERSQWTQPARSDLLYDLPQAHPSTNLEAPSTAGSTSTDFSTWSCQHSEAWFEQQPHRWHEFEALAGLVCYVNAASKATDELNSADQQQDRALYHDIVNTAHQNTDAQKLVEQVQARIVMTEEALRRDRVPPEEARGDPRPVQSGPWSWIIFKRVLSGLGLLDTSLTPNSTFVREARPVPLDYKKYSEDHPVKALVGLNALLTSPRLFTLIMKCTSSRFRPDNIKQLLLVKAANQAAEVPKQFMLFFVKRSIIGNLVSMLLPGLQTCMYGQACVDDNPYLGRWLVVMGLTSQALEIWSLIATLDSTMAPPEMGNVLMCTYIILPLFNTAFSIIFMTMVAFTLPEPNYSLMVAIEAAVLPFLTLWANAIVGLPHMGLHDPAPPGMLSSIVSLEGRSKSKIKRPCLQAYLRDLAQRCIAQHELQLGQHARTTIACTSPDPAVAFSKSTELLTLLRTLCS